MLCRAARGGVLSRKALCRDPSIGPAANIPPGVRGAAGLELVSRGGCREGVCVLGLDPEQTALEPAAAARTVPHGESRSKSRESRAVPQQRSVCGARCAGLTHHHVSDVSVQTLPTTGAWTWKPIGRHGGDVGRLDFGLAPDWLRARDAVREETLIKVLILMFYSLEENHLLLYDYVLI